MWKKDIVQAGLIGHYCEDNPATVELPGTLRQQTLGEGWVGRGNLTARLVFLCWFPALFFVIWVQTLKCTTSTEPGSMIMNDIFLYFLKENGATSINHLHCFSLFLFFRFHVCLMYSRSLQTLSPHLLHTYIYENCVWTHIVLSWVSSPVVMLSVRVKARLFLPLCRSHTPCNSRCISGDSTDASSSSLFDQCAMWPWPSSRS